MATNPAKKRVAMASQQRKKKKLGAGATSKSNPFAKKASAIRRRGY